MALNPEPLDEVEQVSESCMNQLVGGGIATAAADAVAAVAAAATPRPTPLEDFFGLQNFTGETQTGFNPHMMGD